MYIFRCLRWDGFPKNSDIYHEQIIILLKMGVSLRGNSFCIKSLRIFCFILKAFRNDVIAFHLP